MPPVRIHAAQAHHNHAFWSSLDLATTPYRDWAVVAMFYEALHWLEAYLATYGVHPTSHSQRLRALANYADLDRIEPSYTYLRNASERARYDAYHHSADEAHALASLVANVEAAVVPFL